MSNSVHRRSAVSTFVVMGCTLLSRILGFVKTAFIGALFGAGGTADVITLIFNIPNNLRKLLAEGALSTAFIPELSREIADDPEGMGSRKLASSIIGLQALIIIPILLVSMLFPSQVLVLFENFSEPDKAELSIVLFRWIIPYLLLVSVSAVMMAVHNTHFRFFVPAVTPIIFSLAIIAALALGHRRFGGVAMGIGVLIGGVAQILVQYPSYRKLGYRLIPGFDFRSPAFQRVLKRWFPILITSSLFAVNHQVAMLLSSLLPDGSPSALFYAVVFYQMPFGIFSASITTVLYPTMSRQAAIGDKAGLIGSLGFGYRNLWALLVPSAMALVLLGEPIVAVAFQRQAFTAADTLLTSRVLGAYSIGMPFVGLFNITQRSLYALGEVKKPFYCALVTVILDISLSLLFVFGLDFDIVSLAWANSISFVVGAVIQYLLVRRLSDFKIRGDTLRTFFKVVFATVAGAAVIVLANKLIGYLWWEGGSSWSSFGILMAIALAAALLILGLYALLKVEAVSILFRRGGKKDNEE